MFGEYLKRKNNSIPVYLLTDLTSPYFQGFTTYATSKYVFFSLVFANQLVPMSIGMIGALIGFISTLLPTGIRNILIWGNYAEMMVLGQDTSSGNLQSSELVVRNIDFLPLTILFIVGLIAFVLFEKKFQKYEY